MPRIFTVFFILAAVVFQVDDLFPVSWIPGNMPAALAQPMWAWHEVVWKIWWIDKVCWASAPPPTYSLQAGSVMVFFISFGTLSAFLAFSTLWDDFALFCFLERYLPLGTECINHDCWMNILAGLCFTLLGLVILFILFIFFKDVVKSFCLFGPFYWKYVSF